MKARNFNEMHILYKIFEIKQANLHNNRKLKLNQEANKPKFSDL